MTEQLSMHAPEPTVRRLPLYHRFLQSLRERGREQVSCTHIAEHLNVHPTQVRKDLAFTGIVGRPRVGYPVADLLESIETFLGWNNTTDAILVGAGSLGAAILGYERFREYGLNILAAFDTDPAKVGTTVRGVQVFAPDRMYDLVARLQTKIAVLTVPPDAAPDLATQLVLSGIEAIWNFTPVRLEVPGEIIVENVSLAASFAVLSNRLAAKYRRNPKE